MNSKGPTQPHASFGLKTTGPALERDFDPADEWTWFRYRQASSYPGQSFGLGVAVVEEPARAGLHPAAKGTCWWAGYCTTFCTFNHEVLQDVLNAAHERFFCASSATASMVRADDALLTAAIDVD